MPRLSLHEICGYRSGDKGDTANAALFADDAEIYDVILREVTAERVQAHFGDMIDGEVIRYEVPNVLALNFTLPNALGGGASDSLRSDILGKTIGGSLVRMEIDVPDSVAAKRRAPPDVSWADEILGGRRSQ